MMDQHANDTTDQRTPIWVLTTLGQLALAGAPPPPIMSHAAWSVLAYLAFVPVHQPVLRERIQLELFDEVNQGAHMLRNAIYVLRKWLGSAIVVTRSHIALADDVTICMDAVAFLADTTTDASNAQRVRAIARYGGHFLVKPQYGWAREMANHIHERYISTLQQLLESDVSQGRSRWQLSYAHIFAKEREWDVLAHERYIQLLVADGRQSQARQQITVARRAIDDLPVNWVDRMERLIEQSLQHVHITPQRMCIERVDHFDQITLPSRVAIHDYLDVIWHKHVTGDAQFVVLRGTSGSGKTQLLRDFQRLRPDIRAVWFGRSIGGSTEDSVYHRLMSVIAHDASLRAEVMHIYAQLTPAQQKVLAASFASSQLTSDAHVSYAQRRDALISGFVRFIDNKPLLLFVDDAPTSMINELHAIATNHPHLLVIATTEHDTLTVPATQIELTVLANIDRVVMLQALLGAEVPSTVQDALTAHAHTLYELRTTLHHMVNNDLLRWQEHDGKWLFVGDSLIGTPMTWSISPPAHELLQLLAIIDGAVSVDALVARQWGVRRRIHTLLQELEAQHLVVMHEQSVRIVHAVVRQRVIAEMTYDQRWHVHQLALKTTTGIAKVNHALFVGDIATAQTIVHDVADTAWRKGDVHMLRQAYRLMQQLPQNDNDVAWLLAVNAVRMGRFGAEPVEVRQAVDRLAQLSGHSSQRTYEALIGTGISLRWAGYPRESIDILLRVYDDARQNGLPRIVFAAAHALTFAYIDCGEVSKSVEMLTAMRAPKTNILSQVIIALTQSYVFARIGDFERAEVAFHSINRYKKILTTRTSALLEYHAGVISFAKQQHTLTLHQLYNVYNTMFDVGDMVTNLMAGAILCLDLVRFGRINEAEHLVQTVIERATTFKLLRQRHMAVFGYLHLLAHSGKWFEARELAEQCVDEAHAAGLLEYEAAFVAFMLRASHELNDRKQQALLQFHEVHSRMRDPYAFTWYHELAWFHLVEGNKQEALRWALLAETNVHIATTHAVLPVSIIAVVANVLQQCHHRQYLTTRNRGVDMLIQHLHDMPTPFARADFVRNTRGLMDLVGISSLTTGNVVVLLPADNAPRGRRLKANELVPVVWSGDVLRNQTSSLTEKIQLLATSAEQQGATVMVRDLAKVLFVHERTILRAVAQAADQGILIRTYRPRRAHS
ncbi:MAG: hypothetical protein FJ040_00415 [Chloroflexi bacterium]|nr:hypothetical protein [Chloroflexota bacterium]